MCGGHIESWIGLDLPNSLPSFSRAMGYSPHAYDIDHCHKISEMTLSDT